MVQSRKGILNGWKEIGAYVCRDIRTVERWEKQRGLPVRRVPGSGRATVYALVSELDEWLESSKLDGANAALEDQPLSTPVEPLEAAKIAGQADSNYEKLSEPIGESTSSATTMQQGETVAVLAASIATTAASNSSARRRQSSIALVALAVAAGLVCIVAVPLVRGHAKPAVEPAAYDKHQPARITGVPYRSSVAGVDELYLRAVYFSEQRTPEALERSRDDFNAAIAKDPGYAPAYAGLATTYSLLREYSAMPDNEAYPKAKDAAEHAIALDPKLPEAHASLGFIDFFWVWDTAAAEREFRTALALDPGSAIAHHWYGSMLIHEGRFSDAMEQLDIAQRLQPTSPAILSTRALALGLSGHRGEAVDVLQDLINATPGVTAPHEILQTLSMIEPRDPPRYLDEMRRTANLRHSSEMQAVADAAENAYRANGEAGMWAAILATQEHLHPGAANRTYLMAEAEAALGRKDDAIADLKHLTQRRAPEVIGVMIDPALSTLHGDKRFGQLVATIGLPRPTR